MVMFEELAHCRVCPRQCGVNRVNGEVGFCGETAVLRAARAAAHFWEEPCISGASGSGAIFFSGCNMGCVYCQNQDISHGRVGYPVTTDRLADIMLSLQEQGVNNINLVTPTHFIPPLREALIIAKRKGLVLPIVYNTSGYESVSSLRTLEGLIDIYLPDCKYYSSELSKKYSHCEDYFPVAMAAIREMLRQVGTPVFRGDSNDDAYTDDNLMVRGVLIRHLLLPGSLTDSKRVLSSLYESFGSSVYISIMSQYTPLAHVADYPPLNRRVSDAEYEKLVDYAISIGIENAFIQGDGVDEESFIPAFDGEGIV